MNDRNTADPLAVRLSQVQQVNTAGDLLAVLIHAVPVQRQRRDRMGDVLVINRDDVFARRIVDFYAYPARVLTGRDGDAN